MDWEYFFEGNFTWKIEKKIFLSLKNIENLKIQISPQITDVLKGNMYIVINSTQTTLIKIFLIEYYNTKVASLTRFADPDIRTQESLHIRKFSIRILVTDTREFTNKIPQPYFSQKISFNSKKNL